MDSLPREIKELIRDFIPIPRYKLSLSIVNMSYYEQLYDRDILLSLLKPRIEFSILTGFGRLLSKARSIKSITFNLLYYNTKVVEEEGKFICNKMPTTLLKALEHYFWIIHPSDKSVLEEQFTFGDKTTPLNYSVLYYS
jgi:hypothetical protein